MTHRARVTPTVLQFEVSECALAALAMLLGHQGCAVTLDELRQAVGVSRDGVPLPRLRALAAHYGYQLRVFRREIDDLRRVPLPAMVFLNFNHMAVVEVVDDHGFQINDPACGPRPMTWDEMDRAFSGLVLTLEAGTKAQHQPHRAAPWPLAWPAALAWATAAALATGTAQVLAITTTGASRNWALLTAILCLLASLTGLLLARRQLQLRGRHWAWEKLVAQAPDYLVNRSPAVRQGLLAAPNQLADLIGGKPGQALLAMVAGLAPLAGLALRTPWAAGLTGTALLLLALANQHLHLHRRSPWRRAQALGGSEGVLGPQELATLETLQLSAHDEDALIRQCGAIARGSEASHAWQRAVAIGRAIAFGLTAATLAAIAAFSVEEERFANLALAALALAPWLWLEDLLQAHFALPSLHAALTDLAVPPLNAQGVKPLPTPGRLALVNLNFSYGQLGAPLIDQLNLDLMPGSCLGVGGPPGCGKTTLGKLMAGILSPRGGLVAAGGKVLRVGSDPHLFPGSVADNLRLWQDGFDDAQLADALTLAGLMAEVEARGGLTAPVEEGGHNWSGGQRRRLALARVLLRQPDVLIIDETLDGVDQAKEVAILDSLHQRGITVVLISHRRTSLVRCDEHLMLGHEATADAPQTASQASGSTGMTALPLDPLHQPLTPTASTALAQAAEALGLKLPPLDTHVTLAAAAEATGLLLRPLLLGDERLPANPGLPLLVLSDTGWRLLQPDFLGRYPPTRKGETRYGVHPRHSAAQVPTVWEILGDILAATAQWGGWLLLAWQLAASSLTGVLLSVGAVALGNWCRQRIAVRWDLLLALDHSVKAWDRALGWSVHWVHGQTLGPLAAAVTGSATMARKQPPWRNQALLAATVLVITLSLIDTHGTVMPVALSVLLIVAITASALLEIIERQSRNNSASASLATNRFLHLIVTGLADFRALGVAADLHRQWRMRMIPVDQAEIRRHTCLLARRGLRLLLPLVAALLVGPNLVAAALTALATIAAGRLGEALGAWHEVHRQSRNWRSTLAGPDERAGDSPPNGNHTLTLHDVHFAYDGHPVLQGVDLQLTPGEVVALTAPTGSGKTTLLRLLLGFCHPQRGSVTYGDQPLSSLNRRALRRSWGAIQQDEALPGGLLRHLLGGLHQGATVRAWRAASQVNLTADIAAMPMGLATPSHADLLSTGQQQKLLLGRALNRQPRLLVLDEALSTLDETSRRQVLAAVRAQSASCVVVTHDPDTLALCDRQWVLANGRVDCCTTHVSDNTTTAISGYDDSAEPDAILNADSDHPLYRRRALALADSGARLDQVPCLPPWPALALAAALASLLLGVLHG